jgi:hypothetical protein
MFKLSCVLKDTTVPMAVQPLLVLLAPTERTLEPLLLLIVSHALKVTIALTLEPMSLLLALAVTSA